MEKTSNVRSIWREGSDSLCFSIPAEIAKNIGLDENNYLYIEQVSDNVFGVRKITNTLSKEEISKIKKMKMQDISGDSENISSSEILDKQKESSSSENTNMLDGLDL